MENKIKNLIELRTNLITIILTLTAGIIGLFLTNFPILTKTVLSFIGIYLDTLFIINVININNNLFELTKD